MFYTSVSTLIIILPPLIAVDSLHHFILAVWTVLFSALLCSKCILSNGMHHTTFVVGVLYPNKCIPYSIYYVWKCMNVYVCVANVCIETSVPTSTSNWIFELAVCLRKNTLSYVPNVWVLLLVLIHLQAYQFTGW